MRGPSKLFSALLSALIVLVNLVLVSAPASAYGSVTLGSGSSSNAFTAPTAPVTPSISGGQPFAFTYPGGVFEIGAPSSGSNNLTINAYKNGALDTSFNTTGSVTFTSQLLTGDRTVLKMTTYASGTKWAVLDLNAFTNSGNNYLYLGTFAGGYQSTITLPTTASNYTTCTNKLNGVSNGVYTSYSGDFDLVPDTGFASPLLAINCQAFLTANTSSFTSVAKFLVNYSGGTTLGTAATLNSFGGTASAGPVNLLNNSTKKTITNFGVSVNPAATGTQVALTYLDAVVNGTSYSNPGDYDTTSYTDYVVTRITAAGVTTQTTAAWTGALAGTRTGSVFVAPRNSGTVYAFQHATNGTLAVSNLLTFSGTGAATTQTAVTGLTLTASITRILSIASQGTTVKIASINNGSASFFYQIDATTAVITQVATFTTSGGFSYAELLWAAADNSNGADFYSRASSTSVLRVAASTAPQTPAAPATPTAVRGDASATVTWVAPANNGSAITGYSLDYSSNSGSTWTNWSTTLASSATSETVTGLINGTAYVFRVSATNSIGTGSNSASSTAVTPAALPGAPTLGTLTPGAANVAISWTAPASNGGFAITDYTIEYSSNSGSTWIAFTHTASTSTSTSVTGLTNGTSYVFRVKAVTSIGTGTASATSDAQLVAAAPGQPNAPTISNGNTQATVTWVAPAANGCAITAYKVEYSSNAGSTWSVFSSSVSTLSSTVSGLTNGTAYVFKVSASNCMGFGAASASSTSVTPNPTPAASSTLTVAGAGSSTVTLTWTAVVSSPAVTDYLVEYSTNGGATWFTYNDGTSTTTNATLTGLTVGQNYSFRVSALNSVGVGAASSSTASLAVAAVPATPSVTPTVTVAPGNTATVTWTNPTDGGSALTSVDIQYSSNGGSTWTTFSGTVSLTGTSVVTGLTAGQTYVFRVRGNNFFGAGAWSVASASAVALAATAPATVTTLTSTPGAAAGTMDLSWTAPAANGSAITDYLVEYSSDGGVTWTTYVHTPSTSTSITVGGLTGGTQYQFRVKAINSVGSATASAATTPVAAATVTASSPAEVASFISSLKPNANISITDGSFSITGTQLEQITQVFLNSIEAKITYRSTEAMTIALPAQVLGWVDVKFVLKGSIITIDDFIYVANSSKQITRFGIGFEITKNSFKAKVVSVKQFDARSVARLAQLAPIFNKATTVTCVGYVAKGLSAAQSLARAKATCEQISLRNPSIKTAVATSKSKLRAHVLLLFKY